LELSEQQCRRIKSEPDIHQSVKSSEDSMLRRRLTQTAPIPEDERAQVCCLLCATLCSRFKDVLILQVPVHDSAYQNPQLVAQMEMAYPAG
jgi:hypothetical protein